MILNSFFSQIVMLVLAVGMLFFYVRPTFTEIGKIQDSVIRYQEEQSRVNEVNARLAALVSKLNSISSTDMKAMLTYLPDKIDHVAVSRDIYLMTVASEVYLEAIDYTGVNINRSSEDGLEQPTKHEFVLTGEGTYDQVKAFLGLLEKNNYPLDVTGLQLQSSESGLINFEMTLVTYSHLN